MAFDINQLLDICLKQNASDSIIDIQVELLVGLVFHDY